MLDESPRICCIGFQKTGTTSLAEALERLGYAVTNINRDVDAALSTPTDDPQAVADRIAIEALKSHHVIQDSPAAFVFQALDRAYPGSKFILTYRPVDKWLKSYEKFFPDENNALRRWMYGVDRFSGNEARYRQVYESQNAAIRSYFADRPQDFMEMDLSGGAGWYDLVNFLGPDLLPRFPHANIGGSKRQTRQYGTGSKTLARRLLKRLAD
ncbi:MAG: hypothetical protein KDA50_12050 [Rhodobacteraceae bacterium]|nr:hypothetical protein [Paracoccaceae bacterium]